MEPATIAAARRQSANPVGSSGVERGVERGVDRGWVDRDYFPSKLGPLPLKSLSGERTTAQITQNMVIPVGHPAVMAIVRDVLTHTTEYVKT